MDLRAKRRIIRRLDIGSDCPRLPLSLSPLLCVRVGGRASFYSLPTHTHIYGGNISWKNSNNPLSLPPVIYTSPLSRNVGDRISPSI